MIGVLETALVYGPIIGFCALSSGLTFRGVNYPDLTIEGSFALGGAIAATLILGGWHPIVATLFAVGCGALAGLVTGLLFTYANLGILAGIVVSTSLFSINLRVMKRPNLGLIQGTEAQTIFDIFGVETTLQSAFVSAAVLLAVGGLLVAFLRTRTGLLVLATGRNPSFVQGVSRHGKAMRILGVSIANSLSGLAGAMSTQLIGFADVNMGTGIIISAFGGLLAGELLVGRNRTWYFVAAALAGGYIHQAILALVLEVGVPTGDQRLFTSVILVAFLSAYGLLRRGVRRVQ